MGIFSLAEVAKQGAIGQSQAGRYDAGFCLEGADYLGCGPILVTLYLGSLGVPSMPLDPLAWILAVLWAALVYWLLELSWRVVRLWTLSLRAGGSRAGAVPPPRPPR